MLGNCCPAYNTIANDDERDELNTYLKSTVSKVKEGNNLKETATTNGPRGTVSEKMQQSVYLLLRGVNRLLENINAILNPEFAKHIDWSTLLTNVVENLHAVSHFKHDTFRVLEYAMDFGAISKESLKRITNWKASYPSGVLLSVSQTI